MRNVYITSDPLVSKICDLLPANEGRQSLVSSLIDAYELNVSIIPIKKATRRDIEAYHDGDFVRALLKDRNLEEELEYGPSDKHLEGYGTSSDSGPDSESIDSVFGLEYDCYPFPFMKQYVQAVAGSSISAARVLEKGEPSVAINWYGGRHHCRKSQAAGFCYVNDICLAIGVLRKRFRRIFYVDLDLHHGDGVERAYETSQNVATCSIHHHDVGFYPGTGSLESSRKNTYNIPTHKGLGDKSLRTIVDDAMIPLIQSFGTEVLVIQAGCDGLATDPHRKWNLTIRGFAAAIKALVDAVYPRPVLVLGGGGYNSTETAKCWAYVTKVLAGDTSTWDMLPEHEYLDNYEADGFQFWTDENGIEKRIKDANTSEYIESVCEKLRLLENDHNVPN